MILNVDDAIKQIGSELVQCRLGCAGIRNEPHNGIIPRCLILEKRDGRKRSVVVGLNPGKSSGSRGRKEREYYKENGISYESMRSYFEWTDNGKHKPIGEIPYFKRTRDFITRHLGFDGDILWTDLVKCECKGRNGILPVQTLRVCIDRFLKREIEAFGCSMIFALGNQVFNFCSLRFPNYLVVGIPHPSGSYGDFFKLERKMNDKIFYQVVKNAISCEKDENGYYRAIKLTKKGIAT